ncbi:MAG TPA: hypothetical protein VFZ61_09685 [Polyangiales bacterium]
MAAFYAEFRWSLPPTAATLQQYAQTLAQLSGCPYRCDVRASRSDNAISAALAFPHVSDKNLVGLEGEDGTLDFAPVPFIWVHALRALEVMGGALSKAAPEVGPAWRVRRWEELGWKERVRLRFGFGARVW